MTTAVARWGEVDLIDALRAQYGHDHADDMRDVIQTWFDKGNGVAVYTRLGTDRLLRFIQQLPDVEPPPYQDWSAEWMLIAVIPGSPIPTVQEAL